nr:hypothetical protein [Mycoplasmopsis bovis]
MNNYSEVAIELQSKLEEAINNIFEITNNEISINVEDVNILQRDNNSINSSTAIGYILEEYLIKIYYLILQFWINLNNHI